MEILFTSKKTILRFRVSALRFMHVTPCSMFKSMFLCVRQFICINSVTVNYQSGVS
jgi:hypothetical protein